MAREMKDSGVEWIGEIPKHWDIKRLKNILLERKENNNPVKTKNILSLTNDRGVIPYSEKGNTGNKSKEDLTGYKLAYPNDIVLNSMNIVIGSVGLSKYYGCVSPVYYMLYSDDKNIEYYNYIFQTKVFQNSLKGLGNGILEIRMRIPMEKLNNVILPIPPLKEQEKIANYLDKKVVDIDLIIEKTKITIEDYKKYKQSIITKAVTKGLNPNVKMKDSGLEEISKIPIHWDIKKIKYVLKESNERTRTGKEEPLSMSQKYGLIPTKNMDRVPNMASSFDNCKIVHKNDLVFNKLKAHLGVFSKSNYNGIVSPDYAVYRSKAEVEIRYLEFLFKTKEYISQFIKFSRGVAQGLTRLYTEEFFNIYIVFPCLEEQQQIVEYLDKKIAEIDNLIAKKESLISEMEEYKKSLIYECVTGKKEII